MTNRRCFTTNVGDGDKFAAAMDAVDETEFMFVSFSGPARELLAIVIVNTHVAFEHRKRDQRRGETRY